MIQAPPRLFDTLGRSKLCWLEWGATAAVGAVVGWYGAGVEEAPLALTPTKYVPSASNALSNPHRVERRLGEMMR
jgi:hypothetical protein